MKGLRRRCLQLSADDAAVVEAGRAEEAASGDSGGEGIKCLAGASIWFS